MGMDFTKYQQLATDFNNRFGVNFSYQDFETEVLRDKYVSEGFANSRSNISVENSKYVSEFVKLFDQAFVNSVNRKIEPFTPEEMVQEYTKMMNGYRAACKDHGEELSQNWVAGSTLMRNVNSEMKDVAENRQEFIEG